ncbi:MAG: hypothetical protein Q9202_006416 [Teloschistes flavicans]
MSKPHIIVVGSGWAGFYLAEYLSTAIYSVTIISPRRTSAYTPLLASAACGLFNFYLAEEPVRSKTRKCRFIKANVTTVDFPSRKVHCAPAFEDSDTISNEPFTLEYDYLILAPGCIPNTFNTPGVAENALFMKNVSDAMAMRKLLFDLLEKASLPNCPPALQKELLHIAIVGGGPTGVEITAELDDLAHKELHDLYPDVAHHLSISIYDVAPYILGAYDQKLHSYANEALLRRNIGIETNSRIERVDEHALYIKDKGRVPYGMLLWVTGNKAVPLVTDHLPDVRKTEKGLVRILTDSHLRVYRSSTSSSSPDELHDNVFALGDAADILGTSLPTTAEVAVQKSKFLVNFFNTLSPSRTPSSTTPFTYREKQLVSYIGSRDGIIAGKGEKGEGWTGRSAWLAWRSGSVMWTRSWRNRAVILLTWVLNLVFGKEIAKM